MKDKEIEIFLLRIKKRPLLFYLILPFIFKVFSHKLKRKYGANIVNTIRFPIDRIDSILELNPLDFINKYEVCDLKSNYHFEQNTEINKKDEQYVHYLHRLNHIVFIHEKQIDKTCKIIEKWIEDNPISKNAAWHPYNVSERIVNFSIFLSRFSENLNDAHKQSILNSLFDQSEFLYLNFEHHLGHHNHLINNSRALLYASAIFRNHAIAKKWQVKAFDVIRSETNYQFLEDGVHAEQSSIYHLLLTRTYWELKQLYNILNEPFSFDEQLNKMVRYFDWVVRENQTIPFLGHITPDIHWKELVGFRAVIINNKKINKTAYSNLFKPDFILEQEEFKAIKLFSKAGVGILKINHAEIFLSNDPRCQIINHGDQNQLGLDISWHNTHIVRDTGLDSYNMNDNRNWFESWEGQSCCVINSINPIVSDWRRRQLPASHYKAKATIESNNINTIKATHDCYNRIGSFITLSRQVTIKENKILISDTVQQNKSTVYNAVFHFGDNTVTQINQ